MASCTPAALAQEQAPPPPAPPAGAPKRARRSAPGSIVVLDGGMGHQLKAMGIEISGPVGSMRRFLGVTMANLDQPEKVLAAHLAFIDAGADVVTTNSYACVPKCLATADDEDLRSKLNGGGLEELVAAAGRIAREACRLRPERSVRVAGCLPPLAESYRPDKVGSFEDNLKQYRIIAASIAPYADVLLCETMSTAEEARAALQAASEVGLPVWVAWTLDESKPVLRSGESLEEAVAALNKVPGAAKALDACMFNCTSPEVIVQAMPLLRALMPEGVRVGAYANGFLTAASGQGEYRDLDPKEYHECFAAKWMTSGASVIGGCCGIFPKHIAAIRRGLDAATDFAMGG